MGLERTGGRQNGKRWKSPKARQKAMQHRAMRDAARFTGGGPVTTIKADGTVEITPGAQYGGRLPMKKPPAGSTIGEELVRGGQAALLPKELAYDDYLRSPAWAARRALYFRARPDVCAACGRSGGVQLHHRTYETLGRESDADLTPLCEECHRWVHALHRRSNLTLAQATDRVIDGQRRRSRRE